MQIAAIASRYLFGLMFTVFGLNGFLHFIPQSAPHSPVALQFVTAVSVSHFMAVVFAVQLVAGILLLAGPYVPLAVAMLAPVLVNILNYHLTMDVAGIAAGIVAAILWVILFIQYRSSFAGVLAARA